mgnify:CR=1 FL=1
MHTLGVIILIAAILFVAIHSPTEVREVMNRKERSKK